MQRGRMSDNSKRVCLFCDRTLSTGTRSKEDVIPKWLLQHLGLGKQELIAGSHLSDLGIPLSRPRIQGAHTILQGSVCDSCNNGWMSDLENQAASLIKEMSIGSSLVLAKDHLTVLSTWIFKTLALYHVTSNYRLLLPSQDFRYLYENRLPPPGRHIEVGYLPSEDSSAFRTRMSPIKMLFISSELDQSDIAARVNQNSCILTMQIGGLLLQLVRLPPFGIWVRADNAHDDVFHLFPRTPESFSWPPKLNFQGTIDAMNAHPGLRLVFP